MSTAEESSDFPSLDGEEFPFYVQVVPSDGSDYTVSLTNKRDAEIIYKTMVSDLDAVTLNPSSGRLKGCDTIYIDVAVNRESRSEEKDNSIKFLVVYAHQAGGDIAQCNCSIQSLDQKVYEKTIIIPFKGFGCASMGLSLWHLYRLFQRIGKSLCKRILEMDLVVITTFLIIICLLLSYRIVCKKLLKSSKVPSYCNFPLISSFTEKCCPKWPEAYAEKMCSP